MSDNESYDRNRDVYRKRRIINKCDCGGTYNWYTKLKHIKTKRHIKHMEKIINN